MKNSSILALGKSERLEEGMISASARDSRRTRAWRENALRESARCRGCLARKRNIDVMLRVVERKRTVHNHRESRPLNDMETERRTEVERQSMVTKDGTPLGHRNRLKTLKSQGDAHFELEWVALDTLGRETAAREH